VDFQLERVADEEDTSRLGFTLERVPELQPTQRFRTEPVQQTQPAVVDPLDRYEGNITHEQILADPELFDKYVRQPYSVRFGRNNRNRWLLDQDLEPELSDEEMLEEFINYQRSFAGGQTLTTASEVTFMQSASEEDKAIVGRGYLLFDKTPNIFSEDTSWGEMFDGMKDYTRAAVVDPTTVFGLGVGRAVGAMGTKASAQAIRMAGMAAARNAALNGGNLAAVQAAKRSTVRKAMLYTGAKNAAALAVIDLPAAVGADLGYQYSLMEGDAQDEYQPSQTAIAALGTVVLPSIVAGFKGAQWLSKSKFAKGSVFEAYQDITTKLQGQMTPQKVMDEVYGRLDQNLIEQRLGKAVANIASNPKLAGDWMGGKAEGELVAEALGAVDIKRTEINAVNSLLYGAEGQDGLVTILKDAGMVYVPRFPGDNQSNFIGDIIAKLPEEYLTKALGGTGSQMEGLTPKQLGSFYKVRQSLAGTALQQSNVVRRAPTLSEIGKDVADNPETKERLLYLQSVWKRLVTSHPGTTGLNVKGWTITAGLNTLSDVVEGIITGGPFTQRGRGSMLGAIRRGTATLNWLETADQADNFFKIAPDVEKKLFRFITAGVDSGDALKLYGLDPASKLNKRVEATTTLLQNVSGVRIQDELTKKISFMSSLDQEIMKKYGYGYNKFFERPDAYVTLFSPEMEDVVNGAIDRTLRETYSKSYTQNSAGKGISRHLAKEIERMSNTPGIGMLIPFGQFMNNALNTVADYSGLGLLYHGLKRGYGKVGGSVSVDFAEESTQQLFARTMVGWGLTLGYFVPHELEKMDKGLRWNQEETDTGIFDTTYDTPYPLFAMMGRIVAHKTRDGEVPPELRDEAFDLFIGQSTRELGQAAGGTAQFMRDLFGLALEDIGGATGEALGSAASQIVSGFTRPLDPINQFSIMLNDSYEPLDRRQGIRAWNEAIRYVDSFMPSTSEEIRNYPTNTNAPQDMGRVLGGMRSAQPPSQVDRMLASVGRSPWKAVKWDGDYPQLKNRLDGIIEPILNRKAQQAMQQYDFFNLSLAQREKIVSRIIEQAKEDTKAVLAQGSNRDRMLNRMTTIYGYGARERSRAMRRLGIEDMKLEDIATMPDGERKLEMIIELLQNEDQYLDLD
jgi:hypothetical protein